MLYLIAGKSYKDHFTINRAYKVIQIPKDDPGCYKVKDDGGYSHTCSLPWLNAIVVDTDTLTEDELNMLDMAYPGCKETLCTS